LLLMRARVLARARSRFLRGFECLATHAFSLPYNSFFGAFFRCIAPCALSFSLAVCPSTPSYLTGATSYPSQPLLFPSVPCSTVSFSTSSLFSVLRELPPWRELPPGGEGRERADEIKGGERAVGERVWSALTREPTGGDAANRGDARLIASSWRAQRAAMGGAFASIRHCTGERRQAL